MAMLLMVAREGLDTRSFVANWLLRGSFGTLNVGRGWVVRHPRRSIGSESFGSLNVRSEVNRSVPSAFGRR
eukprot:1092261-Pyramimonas_sp.AAC.1